MTDAVKSTTMARQTLPMSAWAGSPWAKYLYWLGRLLDRLALITLVSLKTSRSPWRSSDQAQGLWVLSTTRCLACAPCTADRGMPWSSVTNRPLFFTASASR